MYHLGTLEYGALVESIARINEVTLLVTPYLPLIGTIIGGILIGGFAIWNRKRGATENRAPDVNEAWAEARIVSHELDAERKWRRRLQNYAWEVRQTFRNYVHRVQSGGSTELTGHEKLFIDAEPPSEEIKTKSS